MIRRGWVAFGALGVTAVFSLILSARGLWSVIKGQPPQSNNSKMDSPGRRA